MKNNCFAIKIACLLLFCLPGYNQVLFAQTNIGGIINYYTPVTAISTLGCSSQISVVSVANFNVGDKVLIIQMKGAVIDTSNTAAFGNILNLNNAGNYEFSRIASASGQTILLNSSLVNSYSTGGFIQLIKVPEYTDANIASVLQAQPWNGTTGGVLTFFVSNVLTFNANIDVTGQGFTGGNISNNPDGSCGTGSPDFYYNLFQPGGSWNSGGAMKGEGITVIDTIILAGKGKLANGGGGGNKHNHGGGGGGNFTAGGQGGEALAGCPIDGNMGIGGLSLAGYIQTGKMFLGGGGGCGDYNNAVGSNGANGGGIVIIKAGSIVGNGDSVIANGADETIIGCCIADGVGGGGGGGLIFMDVPTYTGNLQLESNGGHGGDQAPSYGCVGTGGGGGTGAILTTQNSLPANVSVTTLAGRAGQFTITNGNCVAGSTYYATAGDSNITGITTGLQLMDDTGSNGLVVNLGNDTILCPGNTLVLNPGLAASYLWQDGSTSPTYSVTSPGLYWVRVTSGGCTGSDSIRVTSGGTTFNLGNDTLLCSGDSVEICAPPGYSSYHWNTGATTSCLYVNSAGNYYVTVTSTGGCSSISNHLAVSYYPLPPVSISINGDTLNVYNAIACQWYLNGNLIANATNHTFIATQPGYYAVAVTDSNGCRTLSNETNVTLGVENLNMNNEVSVYPNPLATGAWELTVGQDMVGGSIEIFDDNGRTVFKSQVSGLKSEIFTGVAKGIYIAKICSSKFTVTLKLIRL